MCLDCGMGGLVSHCAYFSSFPYQRIHASRPVNVNSLAFLVIGNVSSSVLLILSLFMSLECI